MRLEISGLHKSYGKNHVVKGIDLTVESGEFVVILGPSGCGKTTTLRCLAGLEKPSEGTIRIGDTTVFGQHGALFVPPERRNIGMIFQSYALWPHMTVYENVVFPFQARGRRGPDVRRRVLDTLELVGLGHLESRPASLLSGGQMQRVALARALACEPSALLFDEPLSNLDLKLRQHLRQELRDLQKKSGASAVFVTHDQVEAAELADRVIVMNEGRIVQDATPEGLFARPADRFTADFIGIPNLLPLESSTQVGEGKWRATLADAIQLDAEAPAGSRPSRGWSVWFRPEHVELAAQSDRSLDPNQFRARVIHRTFVGTEYLYRLEIGEHEDRAIKITARDARKLEIDQRVIACVKPERAQLIP